MWFGLECLVVGEDIVCGIMIDVVIVIIVEPLANFEYDFGKQLYVILK